MLEQSKSAAEHGGTEGAEAPRPVWRAPALIRLDMVRTMQSGGSGVDGGLASPPP